MEGNEVTISLSRFDARPINVRGRSSRGAVGEAVSVGIRSEHFVEAPLGAATLTARAQVVEQLGGVSYVYAVGNDGETKVTIQQKGHSRIAPGTTIDVDIESGTRPVFDQGRLRL